MTFGGEGAHRAQRSGGQHARKHGETFTDTFQGKLCEFGVYSFFRDREFDLKGPDVTTMPLGRWDSGYDLIINGKKINVKSTFQKRKSFRIIFIRAKSKS